VAEIKRIYNVPLRREFLKSPKYKRTKKAVIALKQFLIRHMKSEDIKIGKYLNQTLWKNGIQNPPHHVKIEVTKDEKGKVFAEIPNPPKEKKREVKKREKKQSMKEKIQDMVANKGEKKPEVKKEEPKKEEPKKEEPKAEEAKKEKS
jgi:large subunit ribosomal protein L31e